MSSAEYGTLDFYLFQRVRQLGHFITDRLQSFEGILFASHVPLRPSFYDLKIILFRYGNKQK